MPNLIYCESGSDATGGLHHYDFSNGNVPVSVTSVKNTGPRSISFAGNGQSCLTKLNVLADAGRRIQAYFRFTTLPVNSYVPIIEVSNFDGSEVYSVRLGADGKLQLFANGVLVGGGATVLAINTWYRIGLSYTITSATVNSAKVWVGGALQVTGTNFVLGSVNSANLSLGWVSDPGLLATNFLYVDDVYIDDSNAVTDPGAIFVTAKKPAANNVNNFDTAVGANPANRWTNVNEVPLSTINGWEQVGTGVVAENYTLEALAVGDVDITANTIIGYTTWVYAKRSAVAGAFVQEAAKFASSTPSNSFKINSTGVNTVTGNTIVIAFAMDNDSPHSGGIVTCTDSAGNSYVEAVQISGGGNPGSSVRTMIFYCQNAASVLNNGSWTINHPAVANRAAIVMEFSGISATPLDIVASRVDTTLTPTSGVSATPTQAEEIVVGAIGFKALQFDFKLVGTGMTPQQQHVDVVSTSNQNSTNNIAVEAQFTLQTVATPQQANATLFSLDATASCLATFKSSGILTGSPQLTANGTDHPITLTANPAMYTFTTTSATFPSNAAGVGVKSPGGTAHMFLFECGALIAYS